MIYLHTHSLKHYGLDRVFEIAASAGFDGIELVVDAYLDTQDPVYLKVLEKRHKIKIKSLMLSEESFYPVLETLIPHFNLDTVVLHPPESFSFGYKAFFGTKMKKLSRDRGFTFCRQNADPKVILGMIPGRMGNSLTDLKQTGHVSLDTSTAFLANEELMRTVNFLGGSLCHVTLSNVARGKTYQNLNNGDLPLESFLRKLSRLNFSGSFSLKISPKALGEIDASMVLSNLKQNLAFVKTHFVN